MRALSLTIGALALTLAACGGADDTSQAPVASDATTSAPAVTETTTPTTEANAGEIMEAGPRLLAILDAQPDEAKARYQYRNPRETLEFFGIEPGMTVAEIIPGGGWYSKILLPYVGDKGKLVGIDYSVDMWEKFGGFANDEFLATKATWAEDFVTGAVENNWHANTMGGVGAFVFGSRDPALDGTVDVVFAPRAMHHLNRFNTADHNFMDEALADIHAVLKPGGIFAVVQHRAPEGHSDEWASGNNGYLKESAVIAWVEAAGFELVGDSDVNANAKDTPTEEDIVWRLPPTLGTSRGEGNEELRAQMQAIGESDRMTLKFRKQ